MANNVRPEPTISALLDELRKNPPTDPASQKFHDTVMRLAKGIINAWEDWIKAKH